MDNWIVTVHKTEYRCRTIKQVMEILSLFKGVTISNWSIGEIRYD